jgi:hypothetical protein
MAYAQRPQSAQPARRASALSFDDADDDGLGRSAPVRDVRLNLADNESFYRSPKRTRGSAQRPTSAPPERAYLPGTVLSNKPSDQTPGTERERSSCCVIAVALDARLLMRPLRAAQVNTARPTRAKAEAAQPAVQSPRSMLHWRCACPHRRVCVDCSRTTCARTGSAGSAGRDCLPWHTFGGQTATGARARTQISRVWRRCSQQERAQLS